MTKPTVDQNPDEKPSKSQLKREMTDLQKLGEKLVALPVVQLAKLPLPETLMDAVHEAKKLTSHGARRRQLQYIGKIMRELDAEPIKDALAQLQAAHQKNTTAFHQVEKERENLISGGDAALQRFIVDYDAANRQILRQLIRKAQADRIQQKNSGAESELFKYLREIMLS